MTEKELHKLKRHDLLEIMVAQSEEVERLTTELKETQLALEQLQGGYDHLKRRLDMKDERIAGLQETLEAERATRRIELEEAGSIAEAALRLNGVFDAAQKAADQYIYNIQQMQQEAKQEEEASGE